MTVSPTLETIKINITDSSGFRKARRPNTSSVSILVTYNTDRVALLQLDLDPLTERGKHLREDDLLVPHGIVAVPLDGGPSLQAEK